MIGWLPDWVLVFFDSSRWWWWIIAPIMASFMHGFTKAALHAAELVWSQRISVEVLRTSPLNETRTDMSKHQGNNRKRRPAKYRFAESISYLAGWGYLSLWASSVYFGGSILGFVHSICFILGVFYLRYAGKVENEAQEDHQAWMNTEKCLIKNRWLERSFAEEKKTGILNAEAYKEAVRLSVDNPSKVHENYKNERIRALELEFEENSNKPRPQLPRILSRGLPITMTDGTKDFQLFNDAELDLVLSNRNSEDPKTEEGRILKLKLLEAVKTGNTSELTKMEQELVKIGKENIKIDRRYALFNTFFTLGCLSMFIVILAWLVMWAYHYLKIILQ